MVLVVCQEVTPKMRIDSKQDDSPQGVDADGGAALNVLRGADRVGLWSDGGSA
jgi:hypothetical protein